MLLVILMVERLLEHFTKKNHKKQIKKSLELKKQSRENVINYTSNRKATITLLIVGLIKKISSYKMSYFFPEPYTRGNNNIKVKFV